MIKIYKPFEPSTIVGTKELKMTEIKISCGGGMGGSCWDVYTKDKFDLNEKFITINTNRQKNTTINTNFIVQTQPVRIFKVSVRNNGNTNLGKVGDITNRYYIIRGSEEVIMCDRYGDNNSLESIGMFIE